VVAQVREVVETGELDPEAVVTPGIYVDRVVEDRHMTPIRREASGQRAAAR
jgi:acyl CoA:acetate/3-ketoacid CoA transferase alpha subunit